MVERQLPKLHTRVRFSSPAPLETPATAGVSSFLGRVLVASDPNVAQDSPTLVGSDPARAKLAIVSWVANVMLSVDIFEHDDVVADLNRWLQNDAPWNGPSVPPGATGVGWLEKVSDLEGWGGWKRPESTVWGGALNHADLNAVVEKVGQMPWREPGLVQLFVKDQEEAYFRFWMIINGKMTQLVPSSISDDGIDPPRDM